MENLKGIQHRLINNELTKTDTDHLIEWVNKSQQHVLALFISTFGTPENTRHHDFLICLETIKINLQKQHLDQRVINFIDNFIIMALEA